MVKYVKLGKYWSRYTRYRAINNTYSKIVGLRKISENICNIYKALTDSVQEL